MKILTARLIVLAVIIMIVLNGVLVFIIWTKQSPGNRVERPAFSEINEFIISEMGFDKETAAEFINIASRHYENQHQHQMRYREIKDRLNMAMLNQRKLEADSLLDKLTEVVKSKELELYRFFEEVNSITSEKQQKDFARIFAKATRTPDYERIPIDGNASRPPPPKR